MEEVSLNDDATQAPYELDELESSSSKNGGVGIGSGVEENAWLEAYKKLMNKSIQTFYSLLGSKAWKPIPNTFVDSKLMYPVFLFECDRNAAHGFYTLKDQAILNVRP
jgi:hypothetical protein